MELIENKIDNLNFDSTKQNSKWKDYKGGNEIFKMEEMWNESGFDEYSYDSLIFLKSKVDINELCILDIGSGKGQAIFNLALNFKFKKIIGIELMSNYVSIYNDNLNKLKLNSELFKTKLVNIKNININALDYNYENEDIYFIFNSVGAKTLKEIIKRMIKRNNKLYIIYYNALHFNLFENTSNINIIYKKMCDEFKNPKIIIYEYN